MLKKSPNSLFPSDFPIKISHMTAPQFIFLDSIDLLIFSEVYKL
jgi:hypothetical protein